MKSAIPTVQADNDRVRVTKWQLPPQSSTGWHRHEMDYVIVPQTDGELTIADADGNHTKAPLVASVSYYRDAGVEHDVINETDQEIVFIEVEVKPEATL